MCVCPTFVAATRRLKIRGASRPGSGRGTAHTVKLCSSAREPRQLVRADGDGPTRSFFTTGMQARMLAQIM